MPNTHDEPHALIIGTGAGVWRASRGELDGVEQVLETKRVMRVHRCSGALYAATRSGLYRSDDGGDEWHHLPVPRREVYSVLESPDGTRLYAGTHPAHLYVSEDGGESWRELEGLQQLPSRDRWRLPRHRHEAHVRSLVAHPAVPDRIVAGIEVGGVHVSDDRGKSWEERREGLHDDIHHVLVCGPDDYVASTGGGLYRTTDAGRAWRRLDDDLDHSYFREVFATDGRLYAAAARRPPPSWGGERGTDAALFESPDGGESFEAVPYPGEPREFVLAWTQLEPGGAVVAGTNAGRLLRRDPDGWHTAGRVPEPVTSLE